MLETIILWIAYGVGFYFISFWLLVYLDKGANDNSTNKLKTYPFVSVVIPAYNEEKTIKATIESVQQLDYPKEKLEIIVVDDCSKDNTFAAAKSLKISDPRIKVIRQEVNQGKGAALNKGLEVSQGEFFACLDADSFISSNALQEMLPEFENESIGAVIPRIYVRNPENFILKIQWFEYVISFFYRKLMSHIDCIHVTPGPFSVYRKSLLTEIGGFTTNRKNLTEDLEMAFQIQKKNYRIIQRFDVSASTMAPSSFKAFQKQRNRWYKGAIFNVLLHRSMLFNKKYGEFGLVQVPLMIFTAFVYLVVFSLISFNQILKPVYYKIRDIIYTNFDILTLIKIKIENFSILNLNYTKFFFVYSSLILGIIFMTIAFRKVKEKIFKQGFITVVSYIFLYPFLIFFAWLGVAFDLIRNKWQKW